MSDMFTHEPEGYACPFCAFIAGKPDKYNNEQDIVFKNEHTMAFVAPKWWVNNEGHVLVVPLKHSENLYSIPDEQLAEVYKTVKRSPLLLGLPTIVKAPQHANITNLLATRMFGISMCMCIRGLPRTSYIITTTNHALLK